MRPELVAHLDAHWAARLHCAPATLRNHDTNVIADAERAGAEVWLFDKTCVIVAGPALARALKSSVGSRSPGVAFEPSRLREAVADYGLEVHGPESIMVHGSPAGEVSGLQWLPTTATEAELDTAARAQAAGLPVIAIPLKHRQVRRAAEACGFELYATVIFIGEQPNLS